MADSITLVSIITLVDQFHLAARSARMLPMRSSSAPIRQHLQSAIQQTQENRPLFRLFPLEMDTTAYRIMHHSRPRRRPGESHCALPPSASYRRITPCQRHAVSYCPMDFKRRARAQDSPDSPVSFSLISFSSLGPAHTQADCRLPGNPSETNTATRFRLIVSSRPNLLLHGALSGSGRVRFCKMPAYGEDGDKGHVR